MSYKYRFSKDALKERDEIVAWYAEQSEQATKKFVVELDEIMSKICLAPFRYRNTYKHFREVYWKKYHYYIIYFINEPTNEIVIFSLYHGARNPENKYRHLGNE